MNLTNAQWNILNSAGIFFILSGAALTYEKRKNMPAGLSEASEIASFIAVFACMFAIAALLGWSGYTVTNKPDYTGKKMRFSLWVLLFSTVITIAVKYLPDGTF